MQGMLGYLNNMQLEKLQEVLEHTLFHKQISETEEETNAGLTNEQFLNNFLSAKRIEGCSEKSLTYYQATIEVMTAKIKKNVREMETDDLRTYLTEYQQDKNSSKVTVDNIRRILSSFFSWLEEENYILKSPARRIHKMKAALTIKETYTDEALEKMRDSFEELRDLALIDILASTGGIRVGELVLLNRDDINFEERECVVVRSEWCTLTHERRFICLTTCKNALMIIRHYSSLCVLLMRELKLVV